MPALRPIPRLSGALAALALTAAGVAATAPPAGAAVTRTVLSGPSADVGIPGGDRITVASAPDGTSAVAWLQNVAGVTHVFAASADAAGTFGAAQRVDLPGVDASTKPAVAAASGGRIVIVFPQGPPGFEKLYAAIRSGAGTPFAAPVTIDGNAVGWKEPDVDIAPGGDGYLTIHQNFDVHAFRIQGTTFTKVGAPFPDGKLNVAPGAQVTAGDQGGATLAVDSGGVNAAVAFTENDGVANKLWVRKISGTAPGDIGAGTNATVPTFAGKLRADGADDMPSLTYGGGRWWLAFREFFDYAGTNRPRSLVRPFDGTAFGPAQTVDGLPADPTEGSEYPRVALNASGQGLAVSYRQLTFGDEGSFLSGSTWAPTTKLNPVDNAAPGRTSVAISTSGTGMQNLLSSPAGAPAKVLGIVRGGTDDGKLQTLSDDAFGAASAPYESAAGPSRVLTAFLQGTGATARIVAALTTLPVAPAPGGKPPAGGPAAPGTGTKLLDPLTRLRLTTKRITRGTALPKLLTNPKTKPTVTITLNRASPVLLSLVRVERGRRAKKGTGCTAPSKKNRGGKACTYDRILPGTTIVPARAGENRLSFQGIVSKAKGKALVAGKYRLVAQAQPGPLDSFGQLTANFTLRIKTTKSGAKN